MKRSMYLLFILSLIVPLLFLGCSGDDGSNGISGTSSLTKTTTLLPGDTDCPNGGTMIEFGMDTDGDGILDPGEVDPASTQCVCNGAGLAEAQPESCAVCHSGTAEANGTSHQTAYNQLYQDGVISISGVNVAYTAPNQIVTSFTMKKNNVDFNCNDADSLGIYFVKYTGTTFEMGPDGRLTLVPSSRTAAPYTGTTTKTYGGAGLCTATATYTAGIADPDFANTPGLVVVYGYDERVGTLPPSRVSQVKYPFAGMKETGAAGVNYVSAANNAGCVKCHTDPYLKHGYIYAQVNHDPTNDFYTCKACHLDDGSGGHFIWQVLVDDPQLSGDLFAAWVAEGRPDKDLEDYMTPAQKTKYAYKTNLMNDVHMSHAMEFPYPQSMANCVTCHAGKLDLIFADKNFTVETCVSCHPVYGGKDSPRTRADGTPWPDSQGNPVYAVDTTSKALVNIVPQIFIAHDPANYGSIVCSDCHYTGNNVGAPLFRSFHSGYDKLIYDANGTAYRDAITASIDTASFDMATKRLTFTWSAAGSLGSANSANIIPTVLVGLYGWDSKDYIQGPHESDPGWVGTGAPRALEWTPGGSRNSPYITDNGGGSFTVDLSLPLWAGWINNGTVKKVEIAVEPRLNNSDGDALALNAPSRTFNLTTNSFAPAGDKDYAVRVTGGCNNCHEALGTTFHSADRGGNIVVCRLCHITKSGGSHLEMQSRSIDSYVHAIHSFQHFDPGDVDFKDPVERLHYEDHTELFPYPTHGITNCESCHKAGTYDVPDQSKSLAGLHSKSDGPLNGWDRNIGAVPSYITGPASRACGGCHRAVFINEDNAGELAAFNSHTRTFGYLIDATTNASTLLLDAMDTVMGIL